MCSASTRRRAAAPAIEGEDLGRVRLAAAAAGEDLARGEIDDGDVALLVENEFPELKNGLVSAVQLSREADRDDEKFQHVAAWEWTGNPSKPNRHVEELDFEYVKPSKRSYK